MDVSNIEQITLLTESDEYCRADKIYTLAQNLRYIAIALTYFHYVISVESAIVIDSSTTPPNIKAKFNAIDEQIYNYSQDVDYITPATYDEQYEWANTPTDIREQLNRWFSWSNEQREVIATGDALDQPLCDIDRELTRDENDEIIFVEVE